MFDAFFSVWWPDWAAFAAMGRHGAYVWPAVALTAAALLAEQALLRRQARRLADEPGAGPLPQASQARQASAAPAAGGAAG